MKSDIGAHPKILQQRCVHHITSLCIRNMTISIPTNPASSERGQTNSFLYFTLHPNARSCQDEMFKSEILPYSPNPSWSNFMIACPNYKLTNVAVRLWIGSGDSYMPALQWEMSLKSLQFIGDSLDTNKMTFQSNSVVLGMHKSYFANTTSITSHESLESILHDANNIKTSYSKSSLHRILCILRDTRSYKVNAASIFRKASTLRRSSCSSVTDLTKELENIQQNIDRLRALLQRERLLLQHESEEANNLASSIEYQENKLNESRELLAADRSNYWSNHQAYLEKRKHFSQLSSNLASRRHCLLSELSLIFPIVVDEDLSSDSSPKKNSVSVPLLPSYKICNVRLPDSENFRQRDDLKNSIALGFTAQVVLMISHFLLVPLRYPIILKGSSSTILDLVTEKMSDRERVLPLSVKGKKERFMFSYGVFLLNKNIAHLRYFCGLTTSDLRRTLDNVHSLLTERLGTRLVLSSRVSSIESMEQLGASFSVNEQGQSGEDWSHRFSYSPLSVSLSSQQLMRSDSSSSYVSVFQRMDSRQQELSSLRNELFGLSEVNELSPLHERAKRTSSDISFEANRSRRGSMDVHHRVAHLTGLEPSNSREVKLSAAAARAELLGKRADPIKRRVVKNGSVDSVNGHSIPVRFDSVTIGRFSSVETVASRSNSNSSNNTSDPSSKTQRHEPSLSPDLSLAEPYHVSSRKFSLSDVKGAQAKNVLEASDHVESADHATIDQPKSEPDLC